MSDPFNTSKDGSAVPTGKERGEPEDWRCSHGNGHDCPECKVISRQISREMAGQLGTCRHGVPWTEPMCRGCSIDAVAAETASAPPFVAPLCVHGVPLDETLCRACAEDLDRELALAGVNIWPHLQEATAQPDYSAVLERIAIALEHANSRDLALVVSEAIRSQQAQRADDGAQPRSPLPRQGRGPDPNVVVPENYRRRSD